LWNALYSAKSRSTKDESWVFICANIGSNHVFYYNSATKKLNEITTGNELLPLNDPGGKFGSANSLDLRNMQVYFHGCEIKQGDIIIVISATVYINLDPEILGMTPKDLDLPNSAWKKVPNNQRAANRLRYMEHILKGAQGESPLHFVDALTEHVLNITKARRNCMRESPEAEEIPCSPRLPGKMGHATCMAFRIGGTQNVASGSPEAQLKFSSRSLNNRQSQYLLFKPNK